MTSLRTAPQQPPLPKIAPAPEFALTSQDGAPVALTDFRGKVVAVTFIFTLCTETCPVLTPMMSFVQDRLGRDFGDKIAFVSVTVDPERDTPEVLKEYAQAFGANLAGWFFVTGPPDVHSRCDAPLRRVRGQGRERQRGPHVSHLDNRPARDPARAISRRAFRPRGIPARSAEPRKRAMMRILNPLVGLVSRVPAPVQTKLLAAFLAIAALLVMVGAVGLEGLREVNQRTEELIKLQRKIEAYRQVQHDTTGQLYSVASALVSSDEQHAGQHATPAQPVRLRRGPAGVRGQGRGRAPRAVPPRLRPFRRGGDAGRGADPRRPYRRGAGDSAATGQPARRPARAPDQPARQQGRGRHGLRHRGQHPRLRHGAVRWSFAFALGSIALALALGYAISWSLIGPVKQIEARLNQVATGEFHAARPCRQS